MSFKLNDFEDNFPRYIVNRGYNYYRDGLIIQSLYDKQSKTYQGIVSGTENYLVKIKITTDNLVDYTSCNCPYHSDCKHITAYLYYIRELKESNINDSSIKNNYYDDLYNNIIAFYESNYDERSLENMIGRFKFTRVLSLEQNFHENVFNLFLKLLNQINKDDLRAMINTYLYFHYQTSPYHIQELLRKNKVHKELYFMYYEFILVEMFNYRYIRHNNIFDIFAETFEYTNNMLLFERTNNTGFIEKLINHFEYERVMQVNFSVIINFLKERTLEKLKFLETAFTHEEISILLSMNFFDEIDLDLAIYLKEKYNIDTFVYDIKLNSQNIKENLDYVKTHFEKSAISYLLNNVLEDKLSRREIINKLETIRLIDPNYNFYNDEKIYVMALDNGVIDNQNSFKMFQEGLPNYLKNIYKPKHLTINYHKDNHYGLLFYLNEQTSEFKFSVIDNNFNVLLITKIESGRIEVETEDDYYTNHTSILNTLFVSPIKETADRAFNDLYQKVIDIQEERFLESRTKKSKELVEQLSLSLLDKPEVILENKVELDIIMSFGDMFIHHYKPYNNYVLEARDFIFGTKIGNSRMYLVKDNVDLLTDIEEKRFHKYGAQLAFDHNIKSFSEVAVSYLDVLSKYHHFDRIKNNLGLMLSHRNSYELLKLLKGKTITLHNHFDIYDYEPYYINKDEYVVEINLTEKNMTSNLSNDIKKGMLVKTSSFDFILNKENNTLTFVNYKNNKIKVLSDFILENESFRTDLVLNELVEQVIPLINNDILIEDSLKTKVIDLKVNVDSYFDYDDKLDEITVKTKYLRNDLELNKEELNNQKLVISNYTNILETFGFIDNKIKDQAYIINFLGADLTPLKSLGNVYISEAISNKKVKSLSKVQVSVTLDGSILRAAIESVDLTNSELNEVLNAYKRGKKYVILRDNVILTSDPSITNLNEFLELNELSDKDLSKPLEKPVYEVFKLETGDGIDLVIEDKIKTIMDDITNYNNLEYNKPVMYDLLKDYQKSGFKWLKTLAKYNLGGILADDMGLGKTLQVISYLESEDFNLSIVISPKSLIYNWENEINKFKATFKSLVYVGSIDDRKEQLKKIESNKEKLLIITSYDTLRNDLESFKEFNFSNIILDEAQAIKTRTALKTKAVKELKGLNKFVLTGTPIENSIFDLWSIFDFIMPGYLYSHSKFNSLGLKVHDEDAETLNFLIQKTKPFILRRVKKDVLKELPEKEEQVLYTTFDGENRKVYDSYLLKVQEKLNDKEVKQIEILSDLMRLRQLCISPSLVYENYMGESLKIDAATNLINEAIESNHKVLVFSTFVKALDLLKANYQEEEYFVLTGKTEASDRVKMTEEFNDLNSNQKVFFISLKAGGTGLNLTGADIVIHLDPWWNLAAENQATDRAHRIGQENTVNVYKIVMKDSIEERIIELQNKKKELFDKMIDHDEEIAKIGKDDYSYILK